MPKPRNHKARKPHKRDIELPLTEREQQFVDAIMLDPSATAAARKVYGCKNDRTAAALGCKIRKKPNVALAIERRMAEATAKANVTVVDVLIGLKELAFSNMGDYLEEGWHGRPVFKRLKKLTREQLAALSEVAVTEDGLKKTIRFKLHNKRDALVDLGRYLKMFVEAQGANGNGNGNTINNTIVVIQDALSATDGILERVFAGGALESDPPALPDRPVLPLEVHSSPP